jgi:anti-sigma factor RsiW
MEKEALSAWIDGDLTSEERKKVETHLATCEECGRLVEDLETLRQATANLAESYAIEGWEEVASHLSKNAGYSKTSSRRWNYIALAAAATVLIALLTTWMVTSEDHQRSAEQRAKIELARMHEQQQRTIKALQTLAEANRGKWPAALQKTFNKNLALVDAAIAECRQAIKKHPTNVLLRANLMAAYQRKVEFLQLTSGQDEDENDNEP